MKFLGSLTARIVAFAFAAMTLLAACTVVVEEPRPVPPPGPQPGFCTREYDPVCARRGDDRQTFNNGCLAEAAGYRILRPGECRGGGGVRDRPVVPEAGRPGLREARQRHPHLRELLPRR